MFTRATRELLNTNPTYGPEEPWTAAASDLVPSDPTNSLQGTSNLFYESNGDLIFREVADGTSDLHFSQISGEFVPNGT